MVTSERGAAPYGRSTTFGWRTTAQTARSNAQAWWLRHRSRADDVAFMAVGLLSAALLLIGVLPDAITPSVWRRGALTAAASLGLWWRRVQPLVVAVAAAVAVGAGASLVLLPIVLVTLAVRRRGRVLAVGVVLCEVGYLVATRSGGSDESWVGRGEGVLVGSALVLGLPAVAGAYAGARRALVASLRERAERAEANQAERAERARAAERTRIAREMHDVLGHRISLVALHAGALEMNPAAASADVETSAVLIRTAAHQAMEELRGVLGVLRADPLTEDARPVAPQPTLADVARLVQERADAGMTVTLHDEVHPSAQPPALVARTAYRVVQESLTNAARHAPGAPVSVWTAGSPDAGLKVEVTNTRSPVARPTADVVVQGSGLGLVGLRERVELAGGQLDTGRSADDGFAVRVWLPWRSEREQAGLTERCELAAALPADPATT